MKLLALAGVGIFSEGPFNPWPFCLGFYQKYQLQRHPYFMGTYQLGTRLRLPAHCASATITAIKYLIGLHHGHNLIAASDLDVKGFVSHYFWAFQSLDLFENVMPISSLFSLISCLLLHAFIIQWKKQESKSLGHKSYCAVLTQPSKIQTLRLTLKDSGTG